MKEKAAKEAGMAFTMKKLDNNISQAEVKSEKILFFLFIAKSFNFFLLLNKWRESIDLIDTIVVFCFFCF